MLPTGRTRATLPQRFSPARPETDSCSRTLRGKCSGRHPPRPRSALPSAKEARRRRNLPVSSSHGSGRAGRDRAQRLAPSFPSRAHGGRGRLLPRLLQQPTSNRPLGATAQAPATPRWQRSTPGADGCRHRRAARARNPLSEEESWLRFSAFFFFFFALRP